MFIHICQRQGLYNDGLDDDADDNTLYERKSLSSYAFSSLKQFLFDSGKLRESSAKLLLRFCYEYM